MAYATYEDLEARWRPLTTDDQGRADILLGDAAVRLDVECPPSDPITVQEAHARLIVSCEMVKRAMANPGGIGVTSTQQGAGPYQETNQFSNPTGDLYLTKADRKMLACGQRAFTISMASEAAQTYSNGLPIDWQETL